MYSKHLLPIIIIIPAVIGAGCAVQEDPYLFVDVQQIYGQGNITIPYLFNSENESQRCRIVVTKHNGGDGEIVYVEDRWLYREGELHFELDNGFYTLRFTLLSERGGRLYELAFLSEEYDFSIQDSSRGGEA